MVDVDDSAAAAVLEVAVGVIVVEILVVPEADVGNSSDEVELAGSCPVASGTEFERLVVFLLAAARPPPTLAATTIKAIQEIRIQKIDLLRPPIRASFAAEEILRSFSDDCTSTLV